MRGNQIWVKTEERMKVEIKPNKCGVCKGYIPSSDQSRFMRLCKRENRRNKL